LPIAICPTSLADDIRNNGDVVDLLISMCVAAATSHRRDQIFAPFPPEYLSGSTKNYSQLEKVLNLIPSVEEMNRHSNNEYQLIEYLHSFDPEGHVYKLLRWILTVNRAVSCKRIFIQSLPFMKGFIKNPPTKPNFSNAN
jgi:hypothetical protein